MEPKLTLLPALFFPVDFSPSASQQIVTHDKILLNETTKLTCNEETWIKCVLILLDPSFSFSFQRSILHPINY